MSRGPRRKVIRKLHRESIATNPIFYLFIEGKNRKEKIKESSTTVETDPNASELAALQREKYYIFHRASCLKNMKDHSRTAITISTLLLSIKSSIHMHLYIYGACSFS